MIEVETDVNAIMYNEMMLIHEIICVDVEERLDEAFFNGEYHMVKEAVLYALEVTKNCFVGYHDDVKTPYIDDDMIEVIVEEDPFLNRISTRETAVERALNVFSNYRSNFNDKYHKLRTK